MNTQPSGFAAACDGTDLVPGNPRAVVAVSDGLGVGAASVADATSMLARTATTLAWSGRAADGFAGHRRLVMGRADSWDEAVDAVRTALDEHQSALATAQHTAADALDLWHKAQRQAATAYQWNSPFLNAAANAEQMRALLRASVISANRQAHTMLAQARADLEQAGDHAAEAVSTALQTLRTNPVPSLAPPASTVLADETLTPTAPRPWTPPGWGGRTVTVRPAHDGVHDSLSRIAKRELGYARRWPEIYHLNVGQPVGPHAVLTDPNLIQPGWILRLPATTAMPPLTDPLLGGSPPAPHQDHQPPVADMPTPPTAGSPAPLASPPAVSGPTDANPLTPPAPSRADLPPLPVQTTPPVPLSPPPDAPTATTEAHSVNVGGGLVLAGSVVAALAGVATLSIRHRAHGRQATADTGTFAPPNSSAPVVRRLRLAVPSQQRISPGSNEPNSDTAPASARDSRPPAQPGIPVGHRDGRVVLHDIASTFGLGLTGPGSLNAARAVLISALASNPAARAILSEHDRRRLLPIT